MNTTTIKVSLSPETRTLLLDDGWAMFEPEGDAIVGQTFVDLIEGGVVLNERRGSIEYDFAREVFEAICLIVGLNHSEVQDTAVRELIMGRAERLI